MVLGSLLSLVAPTSFLSLNIFPPKPKFVPQRDLPDLSGKVMIVSGGNSGIGYEIVLQLLIKGAKVYIATRNPERAATAIASLKKATGKTAEFLLLDLGDLKSVRKAAEDFLNREQRLDALFNNAGIMACPLEMLTAQGYDAQFGTNVMGPYFFTKLLMPALHNSFVASGVKPRVLNTSSALLSEAPKNAMGIDWDSLKGGKKRDEAIKGFAPWVLYGQSKLANVTLTKILCNEYGNQLASCAVHPGVLRSGLSQHLPRIQVVIMETFVSAPTRFGAFTPLFGATAPLEEIDGKYLLPWGRVASVVPGQADRPETQRALREWLEAEISGH